MVILRPTNWELVNEPISGITWLLNIYTLEIVCKTYNKHVSIIGWFSTGETLIRDRWRFSESFLYHKIPRV